MFAANVYVVIGALIFIAIVLLITFLTRERPPV